MKKKRIALLILILAILAAACAPAAAPNSTTPQSNSAQSSGVTPQASAAASSASSLSTAPAAAPVFTPDGAYDIGNPTLTDLFVDPRNGDDTRDGLSRAAALRTLSEAWNRIPVGQALTTGVRINLLPGEYPAESMPNYWESRYGTPTAPILIQAAEGPGSVILQAGLNIYDSRHLYLLNLNIIPSPPGDVLHCELCMHLLIRGSVLDGGGAAQETIKVNQSKYIYLENSNITNAYENAIDFVAVQYGHIAGNTIHHAGDWCAYVKGGSAYITVRDNEIYNCGTGGFTAGQGTGFQYMVAPWLNYEAYGVVVVNNYIHDTEGAGLGVNGGVNIVMMHNTLHNVGSRSHLVEFVHGGRSCDGSFDNPERVRCQQNLDAGGWGTLDVDDGTNAVRIPNLRVYFVNNVIVNEGMQSGYQHFAIHEPWRERFGNGPVPAHADEDLVIAGNIIWNGDSSKPLGIEDTEACAAENPTCNPGLIFAQNRINTGSAPQVNPRGCLLTPAGVTLASAPPAFDWSGLPIPVPAWQPMLTPGNTPGACLP